MSRRFGVALIALASLLYGCEQAEPAVAGSGAALTADNVVPTGQACTPTGMHFEHRARACSACHLCAGTLSFDPAAAGPNAAFDAVAKTCSNIACHTVPSGTFSYTQWDYSNDVPVVVTVPYGGTPPAPAKWYATGVDKCNPCHDFPPKYQGSRYYWHSGMHGAAPMGNACALCHPAVSGAFVYGGPPSYVNTSGGLISSCAPGTFCSTVGSGLVGTPHGNGVLDVTPGWSSSCIGCH